MIRAFAWSLVVTMMTLACVTVPVTGRKQLVLPPDGYMNSLGASTYVEMKSKEKISKDAHLTQVMTEIGQRLAKASEASFQWEFTLFDSKEVNAWCLPGGKVGVYTGLLPIAKTNAGLAAVMGHEIAHAVARHGAERATQSLIVAGTLVTVDAVMSDPNRKQMVMAALGLGAQFGVMLPYSRLHESEADKIGALYMARAGYDPTEAVALWKRMGQAGGAQPPEFLSTHPDSARRAADLQSQMPKLLSVYNQSQKIPTIPLL